MTPTLVGVATASRQLSGPSMRSTARLAYAPARIVSMPAVSALPPMMASVRWTSAAEVGGQATCASANRARASGWLPMVVAAGSWTSIQRQPASARYDHLAPHRRTGRPHEIGPSTTALTIDRPGPPSPATPPRRLGVRAGPAAVDQRLEPCSAWMSRTASRRASGAASSGAAAAAAAEERREHRPLERVRRPQRRPDGEPGHDHDRDDADREERREHGPWRARPSARP